MTSPYPPSELQHILNAIQEWTTQDLLTLDEAKMQLRIALTDASKDAEVEMFIDGVSAQIANMANRVFGYGEVDETFYNVIDESRLYCSRWPIKFADIQSLTYNGADILPSYKSDWFLEEKTGTLYRPGPAWSGTLDAVYSGGYKLPDECPDDLKRAATIAIREDYFTYLRGATGSGVRMISHKHARVMYYPPGQVAAAQAGGVQNLGPVWNAVMAVVNNYIRHWV